VCDDGNVWGVVGDVRVSGGETDTEAGAEVVERYV